MVISSFSNSLFAEIQDSCSIDLYLFQIMQTLEENPENQANYSWENNILKWKGRLVIGNNVALRQKLIELYHSSVVGGHSSVYVTTKKVIALFYWNGIDKQVREFVRSCPICQQF